MFSFCMISMTIAKTATEVMKRAYRKRIQYKLTLNKNVSLSRELKAMHAFGSSESSMNK